MASLVVMVRGFSAKLEPRCGNSSNIEGVVSSSGKPDRRDRCVLVAFKAFVPTRCLVLSGVVRREPGLSGLA